MDKQSCRLEMNKRLASMNESEFFEKSRNLSNNLSNYLHNFDLSSKTIGVFSPIAKEPHWFLELTQSTDLKLALVSIESELKLGFYEMELAEIKKCKSLKLDNTELLKRVDPEVLLIPGLGFSKDLDRLGRGQGYYDRYLAKFRGLKIGICFEEQMAPTIETNDLDIKMNLIITDKKIYKERTIK